MKFDKRFPDILILSEFQIFMSILFHSLMTDGKKDGKAEFSIYDVININQSTMQIP